MKTENHRKLKGSVLLTVVSVLSIMIIFMTCALAMAAAANKRSRKTYSSSQSSYTARTAIDSILAAIGTDKEFSKSVRALKNKGQKIDILVDVNDPSMGYIENATIENAGKKVVYDSEKGKWVERNLFTINADVTIGGETTSITSKILQDPPVTDNHEGPGGAAFLTYGDMTATQKVQGFGGTYIGMGQWEDTSGSTYKWNNLSDPDHSLMYYYWKPTGDYTDPNYFITLDDRKYLTHKDYKVSNASVYEAPWVVNGNFSTNTNVSLLYTYQDSGISNNGAAIWGDLSLDNPDGFIVNASEKMKGWLADNGYDFMSTPYFYIDGTLKAKSSVDFTFGQKDLPLNIFMGYLRDESTDNVRNFYGNLYLMDKDTDNQIVTKAGPNLLRWSSDVYTQNGTVSNVTGNLYCNGNLEINSDGLDIQGDLVVEGDLRITGNSDVKIDGNLVVGGTLYTESDKFSVSKKVFCGSADDHKILSFNPADATFNDAEYEQRDKVYYLCSNIGVPLQGWTDTCMAYMDADNLAAAQAEYGVTGRDFGNQNVDSKYYTGLCHSWDNPPDEKSEAKYYRKGTDIEVPKSEAFTNSGTEFTGLDSKREDISTYKETHDNRVYPVYATRDVLIGAERFLNVKGVADRVVKYGDIPTDKLTPMQNNVVDFTSGGTTVDMNCTLTGTFTEKVVVKPPLDEDIYIRLNNVDFLCNEAEVEGKKEVTNTAYIEIDESESGTGHAYFVYDGFVTSNYDFNQDLADTRLVKTVYDWMSGFKFDASERNNIGHEGTVYTSNNGDVNKDYTVKGTDALGNEKVIFTAKMKDVTTLPKEGGKYLIEQDTTLLGDYSGCEFIVRAPENKEIWLTLEDNTFSSASIMVDDVAGKGKVNIYLKKTVSFKAINDKLKGISSKYIYDTLNAGNKLNIVSRRDAPTLKKIVNTLNQDNNTAPILEPLRTNIYAESGARLHLENGAMVMGYVVAPKTLTVDVGDPSVEAKHLTCITYDGLPLSKLTNSGKDASLLKEGLSNRIAFIGMLNVLAIDDSMNDWYLLYDAPADSDSGTIGSGVEDAEGLHKYDAVEYIAYAR